LASHLKRLVRDAQSGTTAVDKIALLTALDTSTPQMNLSVREKMAGTKEVNPLAKL
jgi:hypothetical protein